MIESQRRTERGRTVGKASLVRSDCIRIPFHNDRIRIFRHAFPRKIQRVQRSRLAEERRFGRVHILWLLVAKCPPAEADHTFLDVKDRKYYPISEPVIIAAAVTPNDQSGLHGVFRSNILLSYVSDEAIPGRGSVAQAKLLDCLVGQSTASQVVQGRRCLFQ